MQSSSCYLTSGRRSSVCILHNCLLTLRLSLFKSHLKKPPRFCWRLRQCHPGGGGLGRRLMKLRPALLLFLAPNQVLAQAPQQLTVEGAERSTVNTNCLVLRGNIDRMGEREAAGYWQDTRRRSLLCNRQGSERRQRIRGFSEEGAMV